MSPQSTILGGIAGGIVVLLVAGGFRLAGAIVGGLIALVVWFVRAFAATLSGENARERPQEPSSEPSDPAEVDEPTWIAPPASRPLHRADAHFLFSDDRAPQNLIAPYREPHDAITFLDGSWTDDDVIAVFARIYAAHQRGLAFRPVSHIDLIICENSVGVEALSRAPGGYRFTNDFALRAGRYADHKLRGGSESSPEPRRIAADAPTRLTACSGS
jgi:hypothetical protein